jgi:glutamate/tyrosine decarboxylase-like PLP-dependent enzyme
MHRHDASTEVLTQAIVRYAVDRVRMDPPPLDGPRAPAELRAMAGKTVTAKGVGGLEALRIFGDVLAPACISVDHPRFLSFVPAAPTEASILFDLVVGASSIYGGSWMEGGGAVFAENEALRWIADLAGLPEQAGGVFVSGGTAGNLSALVAARWQWRNDAGGRHDRTRGLIVASRGAHSSVTQAARVIDSDTLLVTADEAGRMTGSALRAAVDGLSEEDRARLFAIVGTAGTTNAGVIDDLAAVADVCDASGAWFLVDGAYGAAALAAPSVRARFTGIERADSLIVDPHKWLFAPFDCCALLYRDPMVARAAHTQNASYLDVLTESADWSPADYSIGLTRRARGLPFWFSLATHGTRAYAEAVERTLEVARFAAKEIQRRTYVELLREPDTSVVVFRRIGWTPQQYQLWSDRLLLANFAFVVPTSHEGETVTRFAIVNPRTTEADISNILDTMA